MPCISCLMMMKRRWRHTISWWKKRALARIVEVMVHQRLFGRGTFLLVIIGSNPTTSFQIRCTMTSNSVEGIDVHISNNDNPMSLVPHIRSVVSGFGCVILYFSTKGRLHSFIESLTEQIIVLHHPFIQVH